MLTVRADSTAWATQVRLLTAGLLRTAGRGGRRGHGDQGRRPRPGGAVVAARPAGRAGQPRPPGHLRVKSTRVHLSHIGWFVTQLLPDSSLCSPRHASLVCSGVRDSVPKSGTDDGPGIGSRTRTPGPVSTASRRRSLRRHVKITKTMGVLGTAAVASALLTACSTGSSNSTTTTSAAAGGGGSTQAANCPLVGRSRPGQLRAAVGRGERHRRAEAHQEEHLQRRLQPEREQQPLASRRDRELQGRSLQARLEAHGD